MRIRLFGRNLFGVFIIATSTFVFLLVIVFGFLIDGHRFLISLLTVLASLSGSIVAALVILNKYAEHRKRQQWARVRRVTFEAIAGHLCDLASQVFIYLPVSDHRPMTPIIEGRDHPNPSTPQAMSALIMQLRQLPNSVSKEKSTSDLSVEFYEEVKWDLDQIRDVLTPRVMMTSDDQPFIDALVDFDSARRRLHNAIIAHKQVVTHGVFPDLIGLLEQSRSLYDVLCVRWAESLANSRK